jgi:hypothetical protein
MKRWRQHLLVCLFIFDFGWNREECKGMLFVDTLALKLESGLLELLAKPFENICCLCRDRCLREGA